MTKYFEGVGRRKTSVARVRIYEGKLASTVNDVPVKEYFKIEGQEVEINQPFNSVGLESKLYFTAKVSGGGMTGQIEAIHLGLGRALIEYDEALKSQLRKEGFLTRDSRMVERKKYNQSKARKKFQFSKR